MKRGIYRGILFGAIWIIVCGGSFLAGYHLRGRIERGDQALGLASEAYALIQDHYFGDLPENLALQRGMIQGMLARIGDPYTTYVEPVAHELHSDDLSGQYGGIGAYINRDEAGDVHLIPFNEGPAAESGIDQQDRLIAVDGVSIGPEMDLNTIVSLIRGPIGSEVVLDFNGSQRSAGPFRVTLIRVGIELPSITAYTLPDRKEIGILIITRFSEKTPDEVEKAIKEFLAEGVDGLIMDLRGNSGGLLDSAIEVSRIFLDKGLILIDRRNDAQEIMYHSSKPGPGAQIPMVVLVDDGTASAAEVVAGALRSNGRAILVGMPSYGKGSVQSIVTLSDGSSLHITVARWLTPEGISLDGAGLTPDIEVTQTNAQRDECMDRGIDILMKELQIAS